MSDTDEFKDEIEAEKPKQVKRKKAKVTSSVKTADEVIEVGKATTESKAASPSAKSPNSKTKWKKKAKNAAAPPPLKKTKVLFMHGFVGLVFPVIYMIFIH